MSVSKRDLLARTLDVTGCARALRVMRPWNGILIWNYHRIGDAAKSPFDPHLFSATAEDFDRQVAFLKRNFDVIGLNDLEHALTQPRGQFMMLTFDDGYRDNFSQAYPILKSHGVSATFFIATGFIDRPRVPVWDELTWMLRMTSVKALSANEWLPTAVSLADRPFRRLLAVYKSLGTELTEPYLDFLADGLGTGRCPKSLANDEWMTWDMLREMQAGGMTFGGHTVQHPILANATADQQDWEVGECRRRLIAELGGPIDVFSYPNGKRGDFNEFTRAALRSHGYRWAFSYSGGHCRPGHTDCWDLPRTAVETDIDLARFRAMATLPRFFA
ncbi:MAG: polysaccharide deacetylase family protein [Planctomycetaceae bacterium]